MDNWITVFGKFLDRIMSDDVDRLTEKYRTKPYRQLLKEQGEDK